MWTGLLKLCEEFVGYRSNYEMLRHYEVPNARRPDPVPQHLVEKLGDFFSNGRLKQTERAVEAVHSQYRPVDSGHIFDYRWPAFRAAAWRVALGIGSVTSAQAAASAYS
jgi:hypothetical protein